MEQNSEHEAVKKWRAYFTPPITEQDQVQIRRFLQEVQEFHDVIAYLKGALSF